jgi:hypothetical protein
MIIDYNFLSKITEIKQNFEGMFSYQILNAFQSLVSLK